MVSGAVGLRAIGLGAIGRYWQVLGAMQRMAALGSYQEILGDIESSRTHGKR